MGGINDLRMGTSPDKAIEYLEKIRQKCIDHGITRSDRRGHDLGCLRCGFQGS